LLLLLLLKHSAHTSHRCSARAVAMQASSRVRCVSEARQMLLQLAAVRRLRTLAVPPHLLQLQLLAA
jgi:hypothetical protein